MRTELRKAITEENFKEEFLNDLPPELAQLVPPDLWTLRWSLTAELRKDIATELIFGLKATRTWFPEHRRYL